MGSFRTYRNPLDGLRRYVTGSGDYPWTTQLRTPLGWVTARIPHPHDVRTVNEVFCRRDYGSGAPRVVVDIGSNIGISALYFATRRHDAIVHCFEPVERNLATLRANLAPVADRVVVHEVALAPEGGEATFLVEPVGRYSGLAGYVGSAEGKEAVTVQGVAIADALREVVTSEGRIDLLKIDTEGSEPALLAAIPRELWASIGEVVYELPDGVVRRAGIELTAAR